MRFLKNKIRLAEEAAQRKQKAQQLPKTKPSPITVSIQEETPNSATSSPLSKRSSGSLYSEPRYAATFTKPTKNMIINYGKAIFSFAMSDLAKEYIDRHFQKEKIDLPAFHDFLMEMKPRISGYKNFEGLFIVEETDNEMAALYKKVLKMLGEVFMKYFSVNWIFNGKVAHKMVYLQHRHSVLRRITRPGLSN